MIINALGKHTGHEASIYALTPYDDDHFLSVGGDGYVVKWKISDDNYDGQVVATVNGKLFSVCVLSDGIITVGDMYGHVYWVDTWKGTTIKNYPHHTKGVYSLIHHGGYLFSGGGQGMLTKWDINKMLPVESIQIGISSLRVIIPYDVDKLLLGSSDNSIYEVNLNNMDVKPRFKYAHENSVFSLVIDGDHLYSGGRDAHINCYNLISDEMVKRIPAHWFTVNDLIKINDTGYMASASRDKRIRIWNMESLDVIQSIDVQNGGHVNSVNSLMYLKEHRLLFSASDDRSISRFKLTY